MLYELSQLILGTLPSEFTFMYGMLTFILGVISVLLIISPIVLIIKLVGGK